MDIDGIHASVIYGPHLFGLPIAEAFAGLEDEAVARVTAEAFKRLYRFD